MIQLQNFVHKIYIVTNNAKEEYNKGSFAMDLCVVLDMYVTIIYVRILVLCSMDNFQRINLHVKDLY